jgi:3'-phosphoadenosine 5'-phosphosulfate sulfotransferase (PAPS reductase)/FAD synthetase
VIPRHLVQDFSMESARLHGKLPAHRRAVDRAVARVQEALAAAPGTWAASVSGGKDSCAMLDIAVSAGWRGPLFHFRYNQDYDRDSADASRILAVRYGLEFDMITVASEFDAFDRVGHFFLSPETPEERAAARWWETTHKRQIEDHSVLRGWAGVFIGMRREESRTRAMMLSTKGALYGVRDRQAMTCCPLSDWTGRDVWARIQSREIPYLARYDDAPDRIRQRSEDIWMSSGMWDLWDKGMGNEISNRDPVAWESLVARYPELDRVR